MTDDYQKGSEWRRWDLHVHTPLSIVQQFGGNQKEVWDKYIKKLSELPEDIVAIGVTDYLFIDGYENLLKRKNEFPNIKLIFPNIEFRLNTFSGKADSNKRHNFHVLFDPSVSPEDIKEQLLNCLPRAYIITDGAEWQRTPSTRSLEELGKQIKAAAPSNNAIHSKSDLLVGFENITYSKKDILDNLKKDCFKGKYIICVGYSEWDQSRWDQSAAEKRDLINSADFALTNNNDITKIEENQNDLKTNKLNKLILHSSDAHSLENIGETLLWIKADPTFIGLKQVIYEPERAFIGSSRPYYKNDHQVISSISISNSNGWFKSDFNLELSEDMIAIIGGKGSGKSALQEMIALGAGKVNKSEDSFITKATQDHRGSLKGAKVTLTWKDGSPTTAIIGEEPPQFDKELIKYLPQKSVELLCSPTDSQGLIEQIEEVIFQSLDKTSQLQASNFKHLQQKVLSPFSYKKQSLKDELRRINQEIFTIEQFEAELPQKKDKAKNIGEEIKKIKSNLPKLPQQDKAKQDNIANLNNHKSLFEQKIILFKDGIQKVQQIANKVSTFESQFTKFKSDINDEIKSLIPNQTIDIQLDLSQVRQILIENTKSLEQKVKTLYSGTKQDSAAILGIPEDQMLTANLEENIKETQKITDETKSHESIKIKYQQQMKQTGKLQALLQAFDLEIKNIEESSIPAKTALKKQRKQVYIELIRILIEEKNELEKLYAPLQNQLTKGGNTGKSLLFKADFHYDIKEHAENGLNILDRSKKGNYRDLPQLELRLKEFWQEIKSADFDEKVIDEQIDALLLSFEQLQETNEPIEPKEQIKSGYSVLNLYNWLFNTDHFQVYSSLSFDNIDLNLLSPGQKGIVLLLLFLAIDTHDTSPLIIDQPEDNLDNLSIYKDLIEHFRQRKLHRQIIIATHNPNLVVNTDAEQVVVANYHGKRDHRLEYKSGALENYVGQDNKEGIIQEVCNILEGGKEPFDKRRKKYTLR